MATYIPAGVNDPGKLRKRIQYQHRMSGFDKKFGEAIYHHLKTLEDYGINGPKEIRTRQEMCYFLLSKFFYDKLDKFVVRKYRCNVDENSDWPVPVLPSEVFSDPKPSDEYRRKNFLSCLNVGDVLDCRVSSVQPEYQLRVIHKYGTARILDDLNITVTMGRTKKELTILEKDLIACELIRVAVTHIEKLSGSIWVTVDGNSFDNLIKKLPELGRISEKELPDYVLDPPDPEKYPSYADYLDSMPEFKNPTLLNDIIEGFGLKPTNVYSYYPICDELSCSEASSPESILSEKQKIESRSYAEAAVKEKRKKNYDEAIALFGKAIEVYPDRDFSLGMLYNCKAACFLLKNSEEKELMHALCESIAYKFDPENKQVKKNMSKHLFKAANGCYMKKKYQKSAYLAEKALEVYGDNELAKTLLHVLKTNHADRFMNLEKDSIYELQVKKKQLVTELKKMNIY